MVAITIKPSVMAEHHASTVPVKHIVVNNYYSSRLKYSLNSDHIRVGKLVRYNNFVYC